MATVKRSKGEQAEADPLDVKRFSISGKVSGRYLIGLLVETLGTDEVYRVLAEVGDVNVKPAASEMSGKDVSKHPLGWEKKEPCNGCGKDKSQKPAKEKAEKK